MITVHGHFAGSMDEIVESIGTMVFAQLVSITWIK